MISAGIPDAYVEHGNVNILKAGLKIDAEGIYGLIKDALPEAADG